METKIRFAETFREFTLRVRLALLLAQLVHEPVLTDAEWRTVDAAIGGGAC